MSGLLLKGKLVESYCVSDLLLKGKLVESDVRVLCYVLYLKGV